MFELRIGFKFLAQYLPQFKLQGKALPLPAKPRDLASSCGFEADCCVTLGALANQCVPG